MKMRPTQRARALRQRSTDAEKKLWCYPRAKQLGGVKFRRQEPIGKYIVDLSVFLTDWSSNLTVGSTPNHVSGRVINNETRGYESKASKCFDFGMVTFYGISKGLWKRYTTSY